MTNPTPPNTPGQQAGYPPHPGSNTQPPPEFRPPGQPGYGPPPGYGGPPVPPTKDRGNKVVLIILGVVVASIVAMCGLGGVLVASAPKTTTTRDVATEEPAQAHAAAPSEPEAPAPAPPTTAAKPTIPGDGTLVVGKDIQPGRYRGNLDGGPCYWSRLSSFEGSGIDGIIANDNIAGPTVIEIAPTDVGLKSTRCGGWQPATEPLALPGRAPGGDGVYIVGLDIDPGTYRSTNTRSCYWARLRGFGQAGIDDVIANDNSDGPAVVKIAPSDVGFKSGRCNGWERIG